MLYRPGEIESINGIQYFVTDDGITLDDMPVWKPAHSNIVWASSDGLNQWTTDIPIRTRAYDEMMDASEVMKNLFSDYNSLTKETKKNEEPREENKKHDITSWEQVMFGKKGRNNERKQKTK